MIKRLGQGFEATVWGADLAAPVRMKPWLASIGAFVLVAFGGVVYSGLTDHEVSWLYAMPITVLSLLPMAFLWHRPIWAWRLLAIGMVLSSLVEGSDQPWPWNPTQVVVGLIVLFVVSLR